MLTVREPNIVAHWFPFAYCASVSADTHTHMCGLWTYDAPLQPRRFDGGDELARERRVLGCAVVPAAARRRRGRRLKVDPQAREADAGGVQVGDYFRDLGLRRLAAVGGPGACFISISHAEAPAGGWVGLTGEEVSIDVLDPGGADLAVAGEEVGVNAAAALDGVSGWGRKTGAGGTHTTRFLVQPRHALEEALALHTRPDGLALRLRQVQRFNGRGCGAGECAEDCDECGGLEQHCEV